MSEDEMVVTRECLANLRLARTEGKAYALLP